MEMPRFTVNRWWTFALVLVLALMCASVVGPGSPAQAAGFLDDPHIQQGGGGGSAGSGGDTGFGDPDVPTGRATSVPRSGVGRGAPSGSSHVAGDGGELVSTGMLRLQAMLRLLGVQLLRF
jgi:hypothetical protein